LSIPSASLLENARLNALVVVPNAVQGIFRRRAPAVRAATAADVDRWAVGLLNGMRRSHEGGPVWVRVITDRALLVLSSDDVRRVLEGSPEPFASDPETKRKGMAQFQPDALTISRGALWVNRRRFTEAVLDTGEKRHRLAERFAGTADAEAVALLADVDATPDGELRWEAWHRSWRRLTRRVIFGDGARDDEGLSERLEELMARANSLPSDPAEGLAGFMAAIERYVGEGEEGSLVSLIAEAPADRETKVAGQLPHWFFALQDTLAINSLRALALIASHPRQRTKVAEELAATAGDGPPLTAAQVDELDYLEACLEEAMRLWPTTTMLSRETVEEVDWNGETVPAGTQVLIVNTFHHRDPDVVEFADRFYPEAWTKGAARDEWTFNQFSHGPQGCPGAGLALFLGKALGAAVLARRRPSLVEPSLDPERPLPHMLDFFRLRIRLEPPEPASAAGVASRR
jgi:cytochrome P450